jgi:hypothetical protein
MMEVARNGLPLGASEYYCGSPDPVLRFAQQLYAYNHTPKGPVRFAGPLLFGSASKKLILAIQKHLETRKAAVTIAASIFAARALSDWDGKRSPRAVAAVANALEKAQFLVSILEAKG